MPKSKEEADQDKKDKEEINKKLDTLTKLLKAKEDAVEETDDPNPKEDAKEKSIARGVKFLKSYIGDTIPKDKIDTYEFSDLITAADMKLALPGKRLNPAPPMDGGKKKEDAEDPMAWLTPGVDE